MAGVAYYWQRTALSGSMASVAVSSDRINGHDGNSAIIMCKYWRQYPPQRRVRALCVYRNGYAGVSVVSMAWYQ